MTAARMVLVILRQVLPFQRQSVPISRRLLHPRRSLFSLQQLPSRWTMRGKR